MSALAQLLFSKGYYVQGSDKHSSSNTEKLKKLGINVFIGHNENNVYGCDCVVYNYAIQENNPELKFAKENNLKIITRAELLGRLADTYENVISVSGAHGKTTTTAMISEIFLEANLKPTIHIGGSLNKLNNNCLLGENKFFITEACEFKDSFLSLSSSVGVILNIANEHLDYFKSFENIKKSFDKFASNSSKVVCDNDLKVDNSITFGAGGRYQSKDIVFTKKYTKFKVIKDNQEYLSVTLKAHGEHNVNNALASIIVADLYNIDKKHIKSALKNFGGIKRRFEVIKNSPFIIHDYAHHPDEIRSTIKTLKSIYKGKITVVFQPHTYSRTKSLMQEFIDALRLADNVYMYKTYSSREKYYKKGSARYLYEKLKQVGVSSKYYNSMKMIASDIKHKKKCILVLGAGNIEKICKYLK